MTSDLKVSSCPQPDQTPKGQKAVITEKIFDELMQIHNTFLGLPEAAKYGAELDRLGKNIASLRPK